MQIQNPVITKIILPGFRLVYIILISLSIFSSTTRAAELRSGEINKLTTGEESELVLAYSGDSPYEYLWENKAIFQTQYSAQLSIFIFTVGHQTCPGSFDGFATATATGGEMPYDFSWSSGIVGATASNLFPGNYDVTVIDACGNAATTSVTILATNMDTQNPTCVATNLSIDLPASGPQVITESSVGSLSYDNCGPVTLSLSQTSFCCVDLPSQQVTLTVTDTAGNQSSCIATITINDPLNLCTPCPNFMLFSRGCPGPASDGYAQVVPIGSTGPFTYQWSPNAGGQTGALVTGLDPGTYYVTVFDAYCCWVSDVIVLSGTPFTVSNTSSPESTLFSSDGSATVVGMGGVSPYIYVWDANAGYQTEETATGLSAGTYTVTATDDNGCTASGVSTVWIVNTSTPSHCDSSDGSATAVVSPYSPYTYQWDNAANNQTSSTATGLSAGTYNVTASLSAFTITTSVTVEEGTCPDIEISFGGSVISIGDTIKWFLPYEAGQNFYPGLLFDISNTGSARLNIFSTEVKSGLWQVDTMPPPPGFVDAGLSENFSVFLYLRCPGGEYISEVEIISDDPDENPFTFYTCISITDTVAPVAICPDSIPDVILDDYGNGTLPPDIGDGSSIDTCYMERSQSFNFDCSDIGIQMVELIADDGINSDTIVCQFNVVDTTNPVIDCPSDTTILAEPGKCDALLLFAEAATATDNCATSISNNSPFAIGSGAYADGRYPVGITMITFVATDVGGNIDSCHTSVTVIDNQVPFVFCIQNIGVPLNPTTGEVIVPVAVIHSGSFDNCFVDSLYLDENKFNCSHVGLNNIVLTAVDPSGNTNTCTAQIDIQDNSAPEMLCQNVTVYLDTIGSATVSASMVDNGSNDICGMDSIYLDFMQLSCIDIDWKRLILTGTDVNGNSDTCHANVNVLDSIAPEIACKNDTLYLDTNGMVVTNIPELVRNSSDNCSVADTFVSVSNFTCLPQAPCLVVVSITDSSDNSDTCHVIITVLDTILPVAVCLDTTEVYLNQGPDTLSASKLDGGSTDNCGIDSMYTIPGKLTCSDLGYNSVDLVVVDANGNSARCSSIVNLFDVTQPTAICQDITLVLDSNGYAIIHADDIDSSSFDNCMIDSFALSDTSFGCEDFGINQIVLTVFDQSGNFRSCDAFITIIDTIDPVITCPANIVVSADSNSCSAKVIYDTPVVVNNCNVILGRISGPPNGSTLECGTHTVALVVIDANTNAFDSCKFTITVNDSIPPVIDCKDTVVYSSQKDCDVRVIYDQDVTDNCTNPLVETFDNSLALIQSVLGGFQTDSFCGKVSGKSLYFNGFGQRNVTTINFAFQDSVLVEFYLRIGATQFIGCESPESSDEYIVLQYSVDSGASWTNYKTYLPLDYIEFKQAQELLPPNTTTLRWVQPSSSGPTFDHWAIDELRINPPRLISGLLSGSKFPVGETTNVFIFEDKGGNTDTCSFKVTVVDTITPSIQCRKSDTLYSSDSLCGVYLDSTCMITDDILGVGILNDSANLSPFGIPTLLFLDPDDLTMVDSIRLKLDTNVHQIADIDLNPIDKMYYAPYIRSELISSSPDIIDKTYGIQKINHNSGKTKFVVETPIEFKSFFFDNTGRLYGATNEFIPALHEIDLNTGDTSKILLFDEAIPYGLIGLTLSYNPDDSSLYYWYQKRIQLGPFSFGADSIINFCKINLNSLVRTLIAEMEYLPTSAIYIGNDKFLSAISGNTGLGSALTVDIFGSETFLFSNIPSGKEGLGVVGMAYKVTTNPIFTRDNCSTSTLQSNGLPMDALFSVGVTTNTYIVSDPSGNSDSCSFTITVLDTIDPIAACVDDTICLDAFGAGTVSSQDIDNESFDACGVSLRLINLDVSGLVSFNCTDTGKYDFALTTTDPSSNTDTCYASVSVIDKLAPDASCKDLNIYLDENGEASITLSMVNDGSGDNCSIESLSISQDSFRCAHIGLNQVLLIAIDASGNSDTCYSMVSVLDTLFPFAICEDTISVLLAANKLVKLPPSAFDAGSYSNCGGISLATDLFEFGCEDIGNKIVTLTVTDDQGRASNCQSVLNVGETTKPTALCKSPITAYVDSKGGVHVTKDLIDDGSFDNCDSIMFSFDIQTLYCSSNLVTMIVMDRSGNSSSCSSTVDVLDTIKPEVICHDINLQLQPSGIDTIGISDIKTNSYDNCGIVSRYLSQSIFSCSDLGPQMETLTVTDASGNTTICEYKVFVTDPFGKCVPPCEIPKNPTTINITFNSATLIWNSVPSATNYIISGRRVGGPTVTLATTDTSFNATNLEHATDYEWNVFTVCTGNTLSGLSPTVLFTTLTCPAPVNLVSTADSSFALLVWDIVPEAVGYRIQGNELGKKPVSIQINGNGNNGYFVPVLAAQTNYYWAVQSICSFSPKTLSSHSEIDTFSTSGPGFVLKNASAGSELKAEIYPNPNDGRFKLKLKNIESEFCIRIYDVLGRTVLSQNHSIITGEYELNLDLSSEEKGTYIVKVVSGNSHIIDKVIIN